ELAQVEVFGPVLVSMSFRTPAEAVALANNTRYGLAASVWSQDIDQALDVARSIQAGTVWINSTNLFDASSGFGGYRESGFGREGGREGLYEYVKRRGLVDGSDQLQLPEVEGTAAATAGDSADAEAKRGISKRAQGALGPPEEILGAERQRSPVTLPPIDRTPKMYIAGKQARPDSG